MKPKLTENGQAQEMKDGLPVYTKDDGSEVAWDINRHMEALRAANGEAETRRLGLQEIAKALGLASLNVRDEAGIKALVAEVAKLPSVQEDYARLKGLEEAGKLGSDAPEKIKLAAAKLREEEFATLTAKLATAEKERNDAKAEAARDAAALRTGMVQQALTGYYTSNADKFVEGSIEGFRLAMERAATQEGLKWVPTQQFDERGNPVLVLAKDDDSQTIIKAADGIEPMGIEGFVTSRLAKGHSYLLRKPEGTGGNFNGLPAVKDGPWQLATTDQLASAAAKQLGVG